MTTLADVIYDARHYLLGSQVEPINTLKVDIGTTDTSVQFNQDLRSMVDGCEIEIDFEKMHVWTASAATTTVVVQRGAHGTTAAAHTAGTVARVNPKFSHYDIRRAINDTLDSLSARLFAVRNVDFTYNAAIQGYDLTGATDVNNILEIRYDPPGPDKIWPEITSYSLDRNAVTSDFPSGFAVQLDEPAFSGRTVRVLYSADFAHLTNYTDDVLAVSGLATTAHDLLPLGAALRLSGIREASRNFFEVQPDSRRATEVPAGSQFNSMRAYATEYQRRLQEEYINQMRDWPIRKRLPA